MKLPRREDYPYQSRYCEENIWHLCQQPEFQDSDVVVMASRGDFFPILRQRAAETPDAAVLWDYHVVLLWRAGGGARFILDFDTTLPFCTPAIRYFQQSFIDDALLDPAFAPLFRVMPAREYAAGLLSDRRHMRTADGGWLAEPPSWPPISTSKSNLRQFSNMAERKFGRILTSAQLLQMLMRA